MTFNELNLTKLIKRQIDDLLILRNNEINYIDLDFINFRIRKIYHNTDSAEITAKILYCNRLLGIYQNITKD